MVILSISMNEKLLEEMDRLENELGYSGRSEIIRNAVRVFIDEKNERRGISGSIEGIVVLVHSGSSSIDISKIRHEFTDVIKTQIHNHLEKGKCFELFMIKGDAHRIKKMVNEFEVKARPEFVKLIAA